MTGAGARRKEVKKTVITSLLSRFAAAPHVVWSVLFIVVPLIFVAYYAFTDRNFAFTMENFSAFFTPKYMQILGRSVKLAVIATLVCLLIGYPAAYYIARANAKRQKILIMLIMLPMWMNFLIRTYAWMVILQDTGIFNSVIGAIGLGPLKLMYTEGAVVLGMVYDYLPYMIMPIYSVMVKLDPRLVEAAYDLGCNPAQVVRKVVIPQSIPGVVSGIMMVFVPSISTFYISQKLGGGNFYLIGDAIETQVYTANNLHMAAAISLVLMVILLAGMFVMNRFSDDSAGGGLIP
ncbi:MAG: ABC transporter permease [Ruminococcaceae bacterium]|nr:ABC transporter permease [Oscillospiraceae bacterium]